MVAAAPTGARRWAVLGVTLALGAVLFLWRLGATGLVDETPPLFAASARAMAETGDWLIPRVNGLPRYDKPPLVYWLMGLGYVLPGRALWDPLGTWAARLPSALASLAVMLMLADTLLRWPQPAPGRDPHPARTALSAALAFALSPLMLLWGRIAVSDALFSGLVGISLLLAWRTYAAPRGRWWPAWAVLGLAVLAKGPVAVVLLALTLLLFGWLQGDGERLRGRLRPLRGLVLTALVAGPWYGLALASEGLAFWNSFIGYHNLQRFSAVVNDHLQPWWFFLPVLAIASLPATPLLVLGLIRSVGPLRRRLAAPALPVPAGDSLGRFAACWLLAVLLFFTLAATKLPSYWIPATPAAGVLIALAARACGSGGGRDGWGHAAWLGTMVLAAVLGLVFLAGPLWVPAIRETEIPTLPGELLASGRLPLAGLCWLLAAAAGWVLRRRGSLRLLALQLPLVLFVPAALLPLWALGDRLRGEPVRSMAAALREQARPGEPVAMVGILKPSLHFYGRRVVIYEGDGPDGLVNLADRLRQETRPGQPASDPLRQPTLLMVIDGGTAALPFWRGLEPRVLAGTGIYRLWRVDRRRLEQRAAGLAAAGTALTWRTPRPERY
ncbi:MAG: glycosyltransferase family 39 protein [Synechococcaceae cyanobacterium]|nr:glycosyltransferase family 39 protein [Synechococcaceae cyanobacterium]